MQEYVSRAVVLTKMPRGDGDGRYSLFTERFGKIVARAKSSRKIVSKLAGHLEPGTVSAVRIIEKNGTNVVDALKMLRVELPIGDLSFLDQLLPEWEPDDFLWRELVSTKFSWANVLKILGWDPEGAACVACDGSPARHFGIRRQEFFCPVCASKFNPNELLLVDSPQGR